MVSVLACNTRQLKHVMFNVRVLYSHVLFLHLLNIILEYKHLSHFSHISRSIGEEAGKRKPHLVLFPEFVA